MRGTSALGGTAVALVLALSSFGVRAARVAPTTLTYEFRFSSSDSAKGELWRTDGASPGKVANGQLHLAPGDIVTLHLEEPEAKWSLDEWHATFEFTGEVDKGASKPANKFVPKTFVSRVGDEWLSISLDFGSDNGGVHSMNSATKDLGPLRKAVSVDATLKSPGRGRAVTDKDFADKIDLKNWKAISGPTFKRILPWDRPLKIIVGVQREEDLQ